MLRIDYLNAKTQNIVCLFFLFKKILPEVLSYQIYFLPACLPTRQSLSLFLFPPSSLFVFFFKIQITQMLYCLISSHSSWCSVFLSLFSISFFSSCFGQIIPIYLFSVSLFLPTAVHADDVLSIFNSVFFQNFYAVLINNSYLSARMPHLFMHIVYFFL